MKLKIAAWVVFAGAALVGPVPAAAVPPAVALVPGAAPPAGAVPAWCVLADAQPASRPAAAAAVTASDTAGRPRDRPRARPRARPRDRPEVRPVVSGGAGGVVSISVSPHSRRIVALSNHQGCARQAPADTLRRPPDSAR